MFSEGFSETRTGASEQDWEGGWEPCCGLRDTDMLALRPYLAFSLGEKYKRVEPGTVSLFPYDGEGLGKVASSFQLCANTQISQIPPPSREFCQSLTSWCHTLPRVYALLTLLIHHQALLRKAVTRLCCSDT